MMYSLVGIRNVKCSEEGLYICAYSVVDIYRKALVRNQFSLEAKNNAFSFFSF